jgi:1A family penicillin-binding protein
MNTHPGRGGRGALFVTLFAAFALSVTAPAAAQTTASTPVEPWRLIQPPQSSLVFARDGSLIGQIGQQWRTSISIRTLPEHVRQAFVAIEDHRFYQHDGVDVVGIAGALRDNIMGGRRGASTITQQLVGNMHPDVIDRSDRSLGRKLREQQAAREMEKRYTKEQILEAYLNQISFGRNFYGIESAARHYFGKPAARLTLPEAATLAGVVQGPALYDPARHPERARGRRNIVLDRMAQLGIITEAAAAAAKREPLRTAPSIGMAAAAPYLVDMVRRQAERAGVPVSEGGYRIHTTIDPQMQIAAADALEGGLARIESSSGFRHTSRANRARGSTDYLQGAAVVLDANSGEILALIGGRDFSESQYNRAVTAMRQPGSAFKPFVFAAAIADSIPASAMLADTAIAIPLQNGQLYQPDNADRRFVGPLTMRQSFALSRNTTAVELAMRVGMEPVINTARRLGLETPIAPYPSSAIGASEVRVLDLVAAYSAFATLGGRVEPRAIRRIEDRSGRTVHTPAAPAPQFVLDPRVAFIVRDMMQDAVERGTGTAARRGVPGHVPVAGKTGTTNDNADVWFVGMTPELVAGVWLGFDRPRTIARGAGGGTLAAPIWGEMIGGYYRQRPSSGSWSPPGGLVALELNRDTGEPATEETPADRRYTEYFIEGTEPGALRLDPWRLFRWGPIGF